MIRPALSFAFALITLSLSSSVVAKTSISSLQQGELPCPASSVDAAANVGGTTTGTVTPVVSAVPTKASNRSTRQRWKALLPGSLKSAS